MFRKEKEQEFQRRKRKIKAVWERQSACVETLQREVPRQEEQTVTSLSHALIT